MRGFAVAADGRVAAQVGDTAVMIKPDGTAETLGSGAGLVRRVGAVRAGARSVAHAALRSAACCSSTASTAVELPTEGYPATRLAVSPDGERIAGAMGDRTVRVWDTHGKLRRRAARSHRPRDGRRVLARRHAARVGELRQDDPDLGARDRPPSRAARPHRAPSIASCGARPRNSSPRRTTARCACGRCRRPRHRRRRRSPRGSTPRRAP